jgi:hypothetical protein
VRSADQDREAFRLATPLILWWVWVAFAAANVADFAAQGVPARFAAVVSAILATVTGLAYALALRPRLIVEPAGLTVVNPFRDHRVPWTAIQAVDAGEWVRVHAASKTISCWALYVSARTKRREARGAPQRSHGFGMMRGSGAVVGPVTLARIADTTAANRAGGFGRASETARLPAEAAYLASLPVARAIATRLDARAAKERDRVRQADSARAGPLGQVTVRWAWAPVAAVALPALALLVIVLAF